MKIRNIITFAAVLLAVSAQFQAVSARAVTGSSGFSVFGEPTKEQLQKARAEAAVSFREELAAWLRGNRIDVDTANTVKKYALNKLAARCLEDIEESVTTRGRVRTLSLSVSDATVRRALDAHNSHFDAQAANKFQAARDSDPAEALGGAINALCAAMVKMEPAGARGGVNVDDIRANVQILLDKMEVKPSGTVVEGRQGALPQKHPAASFTIDGKPLEGFQMTAFIQNNRQFARLATNSMGEVSLRGHKVPFVHNGSMLTISPDARTHLGADHFIRYRDLGVRLTKGQELTFIYKVPTLTYTLEFRVFTQDKEFAIPQDFSADAHVRKYLKEICGLVPASSSGAADLNIRIGAELAKVSYKETEEDAIAMNLRAEFRGAGIDLSHAKVFEKRYEYGLNIQMGEFFWEASVGLKNFIAETLAKE